MASLSGVSSDESATEKGDQGKGDGTAPQLSKNMLVISGGEGYIDFRIGNANNSTDYLFECHTHACMHTHTHACTYTHKCCLFTKLMNNLLHNDNRNTTTFIICRFPLCLNPPEVI